MRVIWEGNVEKAIPLTTECPECGSTSLIVPDKPRAQVRCADCGEKLGTIKQLNERNKKAAIKKIAGAEIRKMIKKSIRGNKVFKLR